LHDDPLANFSAFLVQCQTDHGMSKSSLYTNGSLIKYVHESNVCDVYYIVYYCNASFLVPSSYDYDYDSSSGSGLSAGAIAGIAIAGVLLFFVLGTFLIIFLIYLRRRYVNRKSLSSNETQQANQQTEMASAPLPPANYNPTHLPKVYNTNSSAADNSAFVGTQDQFSGYPPPTAPQPQYFPRPQTTAPTPGYIPGPQPEYPPGPQPEYPPGPQSRGQIPIPQPQNYTGPPPEHPSQFEKSSALPDNFAVPPPDCTSN